MNIAKDFVAIVELAEGNHEYKFLVDGEWVNDPNSPVVETPAGNFYFLLLSKHPSLSVIKHRTAKIEGISFSVLHILAGWGPNLGDQGLPSNCLSLTCTLTTFCLPALSGSEF